MATISKRSDYYKKSDVFKPTQPNPTEVLGKGKKGDCAIRAFALSTGISWIEAFDILVEEARKTYNVPNDKHCFRGVFRARGYEENTVTATKGKKRMTVEDFAKAHPKGRYFVEVARHATAVVDGVILDSWNTANCCVYRYFIIKED